MIVAKERDDETLFWDGKNFTKLNENTIIFGAVGTACNDDKLKKRDDWIAVSAFQYMDNDYKRLKLKKNL